MIFKTSTHVCVDLGGVRGLSLAAAGRQVLGRAAGVGDGGAVEVIGPQSVVGGAAALEVLLPQVPRLGHALTLAVVLHGLIQLLLDKVLSLENTTPGKTTDTTKHQQQQQHARIHINERLLQW